jgi:hypothetical protein
MRVEDSERSLKDLNKALDSDKKRMQSLRSEVMKAYDVLKNMALVDAHEIRMFNNDDDVGYIKNKRIFRLKVDELGNISMSPYRQKEKVDEEEGSEDNLDADEMFNSLID